MLLATEAPLKPLIAFFAIVVALMIVTDSSAAPTQWIIPAATRQAGGGATGKPTSKPSPDPLANHWMCFRRTFTLDAVPDKAIARIAVDSKYWLWVNGKLVVLEGGLKRGPNRSDTYIDEVDLTPHLVKGENAIAILAWYFGKEGFSHLSSGMPGFYFDAPFLGSDRSWKAIVHPAFGNTDKPHPNFRLPEHNIRFDATKDIAGWMEKAFDDSTWPAAAEKGAEGAAPWNTLHARPIPLWRFSELRDYQNKADLPVASDGKPIVAKLPYDAQVTPYLKIDAPAGLVIDMRTDTYVTTGEPTVRTEYVTRDGVQEFETPGWMSGHEVHYAIPAGVKILALQYRESG
ncbi:MAG: glycoside hydrolase family 78, partial [Tepidisphaeraceae bacterium]